MPQNPDYEVLIPSYGPGGGPATITFPGSMSVAEVNAAIPKALGQMPGGTAAPGVTPQGITQPSSIMSNLSSGQASPELISAAGAGAPQIAQKLAPYLPPIMGTLGGMAGGVPGAVLGGGVGEMLSRAQTHAGVFTPEGQQAEQSQAMQQGMFELGGALANRVLERLVPGLRTGAIEAKAKILGIKPGTQEGEALLAHFAPGSKTAERSGLTFADIPAGATKESIGRKILAKRAQTLQELQTAAAPYEEDVIATPGQQAKIKGLYDAIQKRITSLSKEGISGATENAPTTGLLQTKLDELSRFVQNNPETLMGDLRREKTLMDSIVTEAKKGAYTVDQRVSAENLGRKMWSNSIREELDKQYPQLQNINAKNHFWQTASELLWNNPTAGVDIVDFLGKSNYGKFQTVISHPAWYSVTGVLKQSLANSIVSGNVTRVASTLARIAMAEKNPPAPAK